MEESQTATKGYMWRPRHPNSSFLENGDKHKERCLSICKSIRTWREEGLYCDANIVAQEKNFAVHKFVLILSSPYFETMFCESCSEATRSVVNVEGVSHEAVSLILDFLYGTNIVVTWDDVVDVYVAAEMFRLDVLRELCHSFIMREWKLSIGMRIKYERLRELGLDDLTKEIVGWERNRLLFSLTWAGVEDAWDTLLVDMLQGREELAYLEVEETVAVRLLKWVFFNPEERLLDAASMIFSKVRFQFISKEGFKLILRIVQAHESSRFSDSLRLFRKTLIKMREISLQFQINQQVTLIHVGTSSKAGCFEIRMYNSTNRSWETCECEIAGNFEYALFNNGHLYIFTDEGGSCLDLQKKTSARLPNYPRKRHGSAFSVLNGAVYAAGGYSGCTADLQEILVLKPGEEQWSIEAEGLYTVFQLRSWSIPHEKHIYFVGEKSGGTQCSIYNTFTKEFQHLKLKSFKFSHPIMAITNELLYVFDGIPPSLNAVDLRHHSLIPESALPNIDVTVQILAVCSAEEGLLIAYNFEKSVLISLYRTEETGGMEHIELVDYPFEDWNSERFLLIPG